MILRFRAMGQFISMGTMMMRDAPARPGMLTVLAAVFLSLLMPALLAPSPAHAQLLDPTSTVESVASGWIGPAKSIAQGIWGSLIVIEFVFFGIQFGLFRQDFSEMFGSMALKIITTGFFLWLIQNADTLLPAVINSFTKAATQMDPNAGGSGLASLLLQVLASVALIFAGAAVALGVQQGLALISAPFVFGNGFAGQADGMDVGNNINIFLMQLIAFLMVGAVTVILVQWALTNIESYIVIFAGIIFLGFTGSRWTLPFAQGYMSYAINVGTKLFTLYLILSCESSLATNVLAPVAGAAIAIGADPTGVGGPVALGLLIIAAANVVVMAALAWYIPNIAGSFLSGQSSLSASSMMSMVASAGAGIAMADAQKRQGAIAHKQAEGVGSTHQHLQGFQGQGASGGGSMPPAATPTALGQSGPQTGDAGSTGGAPPANAASAAVAPHSGGIGSAYTAGGGGGGTTPAAGGSPPPPISAPPPAAPVSGGVGSAYTAGAPSNGRGGSPPQQSPALSNGHAASMPPPTPAAPLPAAASTPGGPNGASDAPPPAEVYSGSTGGTPIAKPGPMNNFGQGSSGSGSSDTPPPGYFPPSTGTKETNKSITPEQAAYAATHDRGLDKMTQDQFQAMPAESQAAMMTALSAQQQSLEAQAQASNAYAMSSMASALPRGESAPAAIQVRLSSPDKL